MKRKVQHPTNNPEKIYLTEIYLIWSVPSSNHKKKNHNVWLDDWVKGMWELKRYTYIDIETRREDVLNEKYYCSNRKKELIKITDEKVYFYSVEDVSAVYLTI